MGYLTEKELPLTLGLVPLKNANDRIFLSGQGLMTDFFHPNDSFMKYIFITKNY